MQTKLSWLLQAQSITWITTVLWISINWILKVYKLLLTMNTWVLLSLVSMKRRRTLMSKYNNAENLSVDFYVHPMPSSASSLPMCRYTYGAHTTFQYYAQDYLRSPSDRLSWDPLKSSTTRSWEAFWSWATAHQFLPCTFFWENFQFKEDFIWTFYLSSGHNYL